MSHTTLMRECVAALEKADCAVFEDGNGTLVVLPDGEWRNMDAWRFKLLCQRVYEEVNRGTPEPPLTGGPEC
jgi:hypothetical protein